MGNRSVQGARGVSGFFLVLLALWGGTGRAAGVLASSALYRGTSQDCEVNATSSAVCPAYKGDVENLFLQTSSSASAIYGGIAAAAIANASPVPECGTDPKLICYGADALQAESYSHFADTLTVNDGPGVGTLVVVVDYSGGFSFNCFGPNSTEVCQGRPSLILQVTYANNVSLNNVAGKLFLKIPLTVPNVPATVGFDINGSLVCGAAGYGANSTECYSSYSASVGIEEMYVLDSKGRTWPNATVTSSSGTDYNPILIDSGEGFGPVIEPSFANLPVTLAKTQGRIAGLTIAKVSEQSSPTVPPGDIVKQSPAAGQTTESGAVVHLVSSLGKSPAVVPNILGQSLNNASALLTRFSLQPGVTTSQSSDTVPAGNVISQDPVAGTIEAESAAVNIVVSTGP